MSMEPENFVVAIHPEDEPDQHGLGVIVGDQIFTCAHHRVVLGHGPLWTDIYQVTRIQDGEGGCFAAWLATSMDFMVLDHQPMSFEIEDGELFAGSQDVVDLPTSLSPTRLEFADPEGCVQAEGFFFGQDGRTRQHVEFALWAEQAFITFASNEVVPGTSGGPLFLADGSLVGLILGHLEAGEPVHTGRAIRIDQAAPLLLHQSVGFERKVL